MANKSKEFMSRWYIINAAKNWFGRDITFNDVDTIKAMYWSEPDKVDGKQISNEQRFENTLERYDRDLKLITKKESDKWNR